MNDAGTLSRNMLDVRELTPEAFAPYGQDNASSHKTKLIRDWFAKRLRWHMHFTPTSASWINQVERFFALLTDQQIKRGAHRSTAALEAAIAAYIDARNADPKPCSRAPFAGPKPPTTSWPPSNGFAAAPSWFKPNVNRNF